VLAANNINLFVSVGLGLDNIFEGIWFCLLKKCIFAIVKNAMKRN